MRTDKTKKTSVGIHRDLSVKNHQPQVDRFLTKMKMKGCIIEHGQVYKEIVAASIGKVKLAKNVHKRLHPLIKEAISRLGLETEPLHISRGSILCKPRHDKRHTVQALLEGITYITYNKSLSLSDQVYSKLTQKHYLQAIPVLLIRELLGLRYPSADETWLGNMAMEVVADDWDSVELPAARE